MLTLLHRILICFLVGGSALASIVKDVDDAVFLEDVEAFGESLAELNGVILFAMDHQDYWHYQYDVNELELFQRYRWYMAYFNYLYHIASDHAHQELGDLWMAVRERQVGAERSQVYWGLRSKMMSKPMDGIEYYNRQSVSDFLELIASLEGFVVRYAPLFPDYKVSAYRIFLDKILAPDSPIRIVLTGAKGI